jgi:hypothetical protein
MKESDIEAILEIASYEEGGLISSPNGKIDLQKIVTDSQTYFQGLQETFPKIRDEVLKDILSFTNNVYIALFDTDFVDQLGNSEKYKPEVFLESAHRLSFEMSDSGKVGELYRVLNLNFSKSTKFSYNLVVKDLCDALDEVKERDDYSKEAFTGFALEVLNQTTPYLDGQVEDKWSVFKEVFDNIKTRYFPLINNDTVTKQEVGIFDIMYILGLVRTGPVKENDKTIPPEEVFCGQVGEQVGPVYGVDYGGRRDSHGAKIILYTNDPYNPQRVSIQITKGQPDKVVRFLEGVCNIALQNLRGRNYTGDLIRMTNQARINMVFLK